MSSESRTTPSDSTSGALSEQVGGDHYKQMPIQPGFYSEKNKLTFFEGDVVKRITRHSRGGKGIEDLEKAIHEIKLIAQIQYGVDL
jgi:hypothetical protein